MNFQPYAIRLIDGSRLTGESAGVQDLPSGLWLFVKAADGPGLSRLFVPRAALESYEASDVATGGAKSDWLGAVVREPILAGEPMLVRKVVRAGACPGDSQADQTSFITAKSAWMSLR